MDNEEIQEFLNYLEEQGIVEWVGMDISGERTFVFNFEKMFQVMPELYFAMMEELNQELLNLYKLGLVDIEYNENLEARFKITEEGKQYLINNGVPLPENWEDS